MTIKGEGVSADRLGMSTILSMILLIPTLLLYSCGESGEVQNVITIKESSSCGKEGDKYVCHVEPGGGSDPEKGGVDDTGKALRDFWRLDAIFHAQTLGSYKELWASNRCMESEHSRAVFSTDGRLRVRVVPRRLTSRQKGEKQHDNCGNTKEYLCQEVAYNIGKMNITIGIKKSVDDGWSQHAVFKEIAIDKASQVVDFIVPGGLKKGEVIELGVLSVEGDEICRSLVDQGYNSENYDYWHQYCSETGFDRMGIAAVKCVKVEIQVVNDWTKNFP